MMKLTVLTALLSLSLSTFAQLPKNGGLTDERPAYPSPEEAQYKLVEPKLKTRWTDPVSANLENVWAEYPRPQLRRDTWANLNGVWEFEKASSTDDVNNVPIGRTLGQRILVPFCAEFVFIDTDSFIQANIYHRSGLSGVAEQSKWSWYRRTFDVPDTFTENTILHFAAVDYHATVFVNGQQVGTHQGGYDKFFFDVTEHLTSDKKNNELIVFVYDPTDGEGENIPIGKQRIVPSHIFYTPCSGIWQTVSLESVTSAEHITAVQLRAAADGSVNATIATSTNSSTSAVALAFLDPVDNSKVLFTHNGTLGGPLTFKADIPDLKTWSPDSPNLYNISVTVGNDTAFTYTGFRTVERKEVNGIQRFVLNGKPLFQFGPLDQGYWPDGLHSVSLPVYMACHAVLNWFSIPQPPSNEAMTFDLKYLKEVGFNFLRKHIKIEPDLFYYATDVLGLLVMQDMPALNIAGVNDAQQAEFERQLAILVDTHLSFPSIATFMIYNEGWGQRSEGPEIYLAPRIADVVAGHQLVNAVSGWDDIHQKNENISVGDYHDNHHYSSPQCGSPFSSLASTPYDSRRIGFQGEFGGVGVNTTIDHLWNDPEAIRDIPQTYEIDTDVGVWNYRALRVIEELAEQTRFFGHCNGGVYTQTTDVEGEVNGFLTYDRAVDHLDRAKWTKAIQDLYAAFEESVETGGNWDPSQWSGGGQDSADDGHKHWTEYISKTRSTSGDGSQSNTTSQTPKLLHVVQAMDQETLTNTPEQTDVGSVTPETSSVRSFETSASIGEVWYRPPVSSLPPTNRARTQQTNEQGTHPRRQGSTVSSACEFGDTDTERVASSTRVGSREGGEEGPTVKRKKSIRNIAAGYKRSIDETFRSFIGSSSGIEADSSVMGKTRKIRHKLLKRRTVSDSELTALPVTTIKWVRGDLIGGDPSGIRVYLAVNVKTGEMMAIKQVEIPELKQGVDRNSFLKRREEVRKLQREGELLADLDHPNIVQYLAYEETEAIYNLLLGYVSGGSIGTAIRNHGKLSEENTIFFLAQILDGLQYLHSKHITHGDLTTNSVLIETDGVCKIASFGSSKRITGTLEQDKSDGFKYRTAPEVQRLRRNGNASKVDIWSVGCLLLEMLTGLGSWSSEEMSEALAQLCQGTSSPHLGDFSLTELAEDFRQDCLAIDPEERATVAELRAHAYLKLPSGWQFSGLE
ncbi:hypothetical protein V5O48_003134 [Marasmius crinis-equi]|uniref:Protein kinase domain-containing protein n=1 Tax=Marasmius crinis-equi TaxID=585013 RepID=A0ABR3FTR2_9AGAR